MKQVILQSPKQFKIGLERAKGVKIEGKFDNIIVGGMGGSALPANILTTYLPDLPIPVYSHRSYGLPPQANKRSLIFCISFSGNTEETLSAYREAVDKSFKVVAITTGGRLEKLAKEKDLPLVIVPNDCLQPRFGIGYQSSALLAVLSNSGVIENQTKALLDLSKILNPEKLEKQGKKLAEKLIDKIPVVYASDRHKSIARIWKIKLNENSKIMAFFNYFPELNHNEMVGLTNLKGKFHFIILRDNSDHSGNLKRMRLFADLAKEKGAGVDFIDIEGRSVLEKMFNALLVGDWTSYYLALAYNQDPVPVKIVEEFKGRLKK